MGSLKSLTVTKKDLVDGIAAELDVPPNEVQQILHLFLNRIVNHLAKGGRVEFRDFGVFEVVKRKQKIGRNPKNAAVPIVIPERNSVKFSPSKKLRTILANDDI
jgi:integration host factor subunit beta